MARIQAEHLTFAYEGSYDPVFEDANFQLDTDWKLGFTGRNGRGKTTFLRLLMGEMSYQGKINAPVSFDYFPFSVDESKTPLDIAAQRDEEGQIWRFLKEFSLLNVREDALTRPFSTLSQGERTKTLLALLFCREHRFLLIDEPTNHLDMQGRALVSAYLNAKRGFILVSHDQSFLDGCVDHILSINRKNITVQKGNYSSFARNKQMEDDFERAENDKRLREISDLKQAARQAGQWADKAENTKIGLKKPGVEKQNGLRAYIGEKSRRMQQRRANLQNRMEKSIDEKEKLLKNIEQADPLKLFPLVHPAGTLVDMDGVTAGYDGRPVTGPVTLRIQNGDRVALLGGNGSGKSSLIKLITGEMTPLSGAMRLASGLIISHVPQSARLSGPIEDFIQESGVDATLFFTILRKLDLSRAQFDKDMAAYSAGQQKKALIARSLCQRAHLYIWDEPLNYVDILSREQIRRLILDYKPTLLLVEHDKTFVEGVCTRLLTL